MILLTWIFWTADFCSGQISDNFYGDLQRAHDLAAIDIQRGRDMGLRGYNDYRHLCGIKAVKQFDDLLDVMDVEVRFYDTLRPTELWNIRQTYNIYYELICIFFRKWKH